MTLSELISALLQKYTISQRKVAERAGINYVTLNRIIKGYDYRVTKETVEKIARGIGCTKSESEELVRAAGRMPESLENKFRESEKAARLFRRLQELDADEIEKLLDELERNKTN
jgi:transcriptional regulator with XRE-family HTH domain